MLFENHKFLSGHKFVPYAENESERLQKHFPSFGVENCGTLEPGGWFTWLEALKLSDQWYSFKTFEDDVMVMSFPKSGTMWLSEVIWCMRNFHKIQSEEANRSLLFRVPSFSMDASWKNDQDTLFGAAEKLFPDMQNNGAVLLQVAEKTQRPRTVRTHHSFSLCTDDMLEKTKVVFIARNPKDVVISFFHFYNLIKSFQFNGDFDDFLDIFIEGKTPFSPFWEMNQEAWDRRHHPNLHYVYFEDLKKDIKHEMEKINEFLGTNLSSSQLDEIKEFTSFSSIKKRDPVFSSFQRGDNDNSITTKNSNNFFRKGKSGGWKETLTVYQNEKLDKWIEKQSETYSVRFKYQ